MTPLITKADGTKYGKTESGTVWVDPELTSAYAFHQFFLNAEDSKVIEYLKIFSPRSREEIEDLARKTEEEPWRRAAQHCLADDLTDLVHGVEQRKAAELQPRPFSDVASCATSMSGRCSLCLTSSVPPITKVASTRQWLTRWLPLVWSTPSLRAGVLSPRVGLTSTMLKSLILISV